jgi:3-oxoacyl-[acyl-carrier-protein] synthase III
MARLRALGCYVPSRVVDNAELAGLVAADPTWIVQNTGIRQRRFAASHETVISLGVQAASQCLASVRLRAREIGLLLVASGSAERRFPGPATAIAAALDMDHAPAIDLQLRAQGLSLASPLQHRSALFFGHVLVIAAEIMSRTISFDPENRDTAVLFGDGAGACLVSPDEGFAEIADFLLASDGTFADALTLNYGTFLQMEGELSSCRRPGKSLARSWSSWNAKGSSRMTSVRSSSTRPIST